MLARTDGLTGLNNRRSFEEHAEEEWRRAQRNVWPLSMLLIDVDSFKGFNDIYGHSAGDDALISVGHCIAQSVRRPGDTAARYGGEEFAVLVRGVNKENAATLGERLRREVAEMHLSKDTGEKLSVTISVGVSLFPIVNPADVPSEQIGGKLIELADAALYRAKNGGRNRVEF
jgi:diguanylate cyclase (GGDEF)-like protein